MHVGLYIQRGSTVHTLYKQYLHVPTKDERWCESERERERERKKERKEKERGKERVSV